MERPQEPNGHPGPNDVDSILAVARDHLPADKQDFDVEKWFAEWVKVPPPALGGRRPKDLLDTPIGRRAVKCVVGAMGSGAYV